MSLEEELKDAERQYQKGVKQLCADGISRVPNKYVWPVQERPVGDKLKSSKAKLVSLPVIDFAELQGPNRPEALKSLANACERYGIFQVGWLLLNCNWLLNPYHFLKLLKGRSMNFGGLYGCMQLVNHSIPSEVLSSMVEVSKRFFELPYEERARYMSSNMFAPVRYGTSFNQNKDKVFCWRDFLKLTCHPPSDILTHWPSSPTDMRYYDVLFQTFMY